MTCLARLAKLTAFLRTRTGLPTEIDIPSWIAVRHGPAFRPVAAEADAVTVLAYRERAPAILNAAEEARAILTMLGRHYRLGVETRASREGAHVTFFQEGRRAMERELNAVTSTIGEEATFDGIAIHELDGWRQLPN